jgi:hypothetical protein
MPNWCNNNVIFSGENVDKVDEMFAKIIEEQQANDLGMRPDWEACKKNDALYMFYIEKNDIGSYRFQSKWAPAMNTIYLIGRRFKIAFEMDWDEPGMGLYGKMIFDPSMPDVVMMADASNTNFRYDNEKERYIYNGEEYESEYEFIDDVIDTTPLLPISKDQLLIP